MRKHRFSTLIFLCYTYFLRKQTEYYKLLRKIPEMLFKQCYRLRATIVRESIPQRWCWHLGRAGLNFQSQHTVFCFLEYDFGRALRTSLYISDVILQELKRSIYMLLAAVRPWEKRCRSSANEFLTIKWDTWWCGDTRIIKMVSKIIMNISNENYFV